MNTFKRKKIHHEIRQQIIGWALFILCSLFFVAASLKNKDLLTLIGSVLFFISCLVFIVPLIKKKG